MQAMTTEYELSSVKISTDEEFPAMQKVEKDNIEDYTIVNNQRRWKTNVVIINSKPVFITIKDDDLFISMEDIYHAFDIDDSKKTATKRLLTRLVEPTILFEKQKSPEYINVKYLSLIISLIAPSYVDGETILNVLLHKTTGFNKIDQKNVEPIKKEAKPKEKKVAEKQFLVIQNKIDAEESTISLLKDYQVSENIGYTFDKKTKENVKISDVVKIEVGLECKIGMVKTKLEEVIGELPKITITRIKFDRHITQDEIKKIKAIDFNSIDFPEVEKTSETKPKEVKPKEVKPKEVKPKEVKPKEVKPKEVKQKGKSKEVKHEEESSDDELIVPRL